MLLQLVRRATARAVGSTPDQHESDRHFLHIGQVLLQVLERIFDLQGKQTPQALAVFGGCHLGFVKHLNGHGITAIDQRRKTHQALCAFANFHEFRQLAKGPSDIARFSNNAACIHNPLR